MAIQVPVRGKTYEWGRSTSVLSTTYSKNEGKTKRKNDDKTKTFKPSKRAYVLVHSETTEKFK